MTAKELEKLVKERGWYLVRKKGSHNIYKHGSYKGIIVIPFHGKKDIPIGTLKSIMRQADIK